MLTFAGAIVAMATAVMRVGMLCALVMEVVVLMGMDMVVAVDMLVGMGVGHAVVSVFVCMGVGMLVVMGMTAHMIVIKMHSDAPLLFFLYYNGEAAGCQTSKSALRMSPMV
jgi:hypothetical protein